MFCYKLAQFRQRKTDSQTSTKKTKKKKSSSNSKQGDHPEEVSEAGLSQNHESHSQTVPSGASTTAEFTIMRTMPHGEIIKHDKTYTIEPESEVSTTADDYSTEEEEFGVQETFSERGTHSSQARLEVMEDELAGKQQEIEELNRELEEMRAAYGTEGLQQLQEFETAIKQRDSIITQLTTNLQQARKEKDDIMREFLDLTEQSQKLKIQFQHLQAGETLRNTSHTSTAADLLHSKQQILTYQLQLEEQGHQLRQYQKEKDAFQEQVKSLQDQLHRLEQVHQKELELSYEQKMNEKDLEVDNLKRTLHEEEIKCLELKERMCASEKSADELTEQLTQKCQEINSLSEELKLSRQKERRSSDEIKQLMGAVEDLQKKNYIDSQSEADLVHRMELETQKKLEQLQAELDEMHGQQIVQLKQELVKQHLGEIERLSAQHRQEVDSIQSQRVIQATNEQINQLNAVITELNDKLLQADQQGIKMKEDFSQRLETVSSEKSHLQRQIEDLVQDLSFAREQVHRAKQSLTEKDNKLNEASSLFATIDNLKAELGAAHEFTKELESKHEAEVTNYKIKLEMLEREKDAVLDRMAESQEAEFEKLRTHFLFSQEEELCKLRDDLTLEHKTNIENMKDNLEVHFKQQIDQIQNEMSQTINVLRSEKDLLVTENNNLTLEISKINNLTQPVSDPESDELLNRINELQKELDRFREVEKEKGSAEQEVQVLKLRIDFLEHEVKDKDAVREKMVALEEDTRLLKDENATLHNVLKEPSTKDCGQVTEQVHSDYLDLKDKIEILSSENERLQTLELQLSSENKRLQTLELQLSSENKRLQTLELQLKEEIQRQKNTFSFAEKNFEVNYQELQEEYTCLVKVKEQLENSKAKQEEQFKSQLDALNEQLKKSKGSLTLEHHLGSTESVKTDQCDAGEIVEKDTTELMEKLENAQRDKQELSLKLSNLSEQLQVKQNEINRLKEQVQSLFCGRDHVKLEDVNVVNGRSGESRLEVSDNETPANDERLTAEPVHTRGCFPPAASLSLCPVLSAEERESLVRRLQELASNPDSGYTQLGSVSLEKDDLLRTLDRILREQDDRGLQLEAQRISLTQIHQAHLELVREGLQAEQESELSSLRESLLTAHSREIQELRDQHQRQLAQQPPPADEGESFPVLTEMLMKIIHKECDHINQVLGRQTEKEEEKKGSGTLHDVTHIASLGQYRSAVQTLHINLNILLERVLKEYKHVKSISSCMEKAEDLEAGRGQADITGITQIVIGPQNSELSQPDVQEDLIVAQSPMEEMEKLKMEFSQQRAHLEDKHCEEIEHLRSYFQHQLKENEDRFSKEIFHLQEQFQRVPMGSVEFGELRENEPGDDLASQEAAIFRSVCSEVPHVSKTDEASPMGDHFVRMSGGPIYHQLQTLRQALYAKYLEEVNALRKQHEVELNQLRADLTAAHDTEKVVLRQEIIHLANAKQEILNGRFQQPALCPVTEEEEESPADLNQLLEERYQGKIEEEVARVIVEMTIAFAQQTELTRLSSLKIAEIAGEQETPPITIHDGVVTDQVGPNPLTEQTQDLQSLELKLQGNIQAKEILTADRQEVDLSLMTSTHKNELSLESRDINLVMESDSKEKTVTLKEQDYNQMVAMGAESVKFKQMYDERVEEMTQELVRQEQEYQQAAEALRLAHAAQLERQMYDQEQLLAELHRVRAQLAQNASVISENQVTDREKILLEELASVKQTCAELAGQTPVSAVQDGSSQTQDEPTPQPETGKPGLDYGQGDAEKRAEDDEFSSGDPTIERKSLKRANKHLLDILLEIVKTTGAVEETIGRHILSLLDKSGRRQSTCKGILWSAKPEDLAASPAAGVAITGADDGKTCMMGKDSSTHSEADTLLLDAPLQLTEGDICGTELSPEEEAQILTISIRLQSAVEKLLEAINETSNQLEHAKAAQTELVRESIKRKQETTDLLRCQEELQERLNEEASAREHLVLELSKAEGLLDGYTDERVFLEKQLQEKGDLIRHLEQELRSTGNRLQELEQERQQIEEEKELLSRQKQALKADAAPAEQQLLEETEKLLKEKIEVQRQAEKDSGDLHKHVKVLEAELEEQVNRYMELEQEKNADLEDLRQKNLSLEKQLEKTRRFLDEQAVDREHERDVFQQEIQKLEQQLKMPPRHQLVNDHESNEVGKLENSLKEKTDRCSELVLCKEQLQRDVQERNEEIDKLECRVRELEQALLISADSLQKAEERRASIVIGVKGEMPLEAQLQVEREAIDRKEKEVTNLVEQLEQFREELENKNEEVQQLHMQLQIQRKESATRLQELEQENKLLQEGIQSTEHGHQETTLSKTEEVDQMLSSQEIDLLNEQMVNSQAQLEAATLNQAIEEKNEQIKEYKSQIKCLKSDQERLRKNNEEEVEKLNEVIEKLQEELSRIGQKGSADATSAAEESEGNMHRFAGTDDTRGISQPVGGENKLPLPNTEGINLSANKIVNNIGAELENTSSNYMQNKGSISTSQASEPLQEDMQAAMMDMESQLQQLQQAIKEKDSHLKQYSEQIITLKEETQVIQALNDTIESLQLQLADKEKRIWEIERSKHQFSSVSKERLEIPKIEINGTDVMLLASELEAAKAEVEQLQEELENIRNSSEAVATNQMSDIILEDETGASCTVGIEKLTEALEEKTAKLLSMEALLESVEEASQSTIHQLEAQLQDLQKTIQEKDSQLQQLVNSTNLQENQEIEHVRDTIRTLHQDVVTVEQKTVVGSHVKAEREEETIRTKAELEDTKLEMILLKEELKNLRESQRQRDVSEDVESSKHGSDEEGSIATILKQTLLEETARSSASQAKVAPIEETALQKMELQLQELQNIIQQKDSELLQYIGQKDLLIQQTKEIEQLNGEIRALQQSFLAVEQNMTMNSEVKTENGESEASPKQSLQGDHPSLLHKVVDVGEVNSELETSKTEVTLLKEELEQLRESQKLKDGVAAKTEHKASNLEQALSEMNAELLASQAMFTTLDTTTQATIHNMETQLQELQQVVQEKNMALLQYQDQQNLVVQQAKEIEQLNDVINKLHEELGEARQMSLEESENNAQRPAAEMLSQQMNGEAASVIHKVKVKPVKEESGDDTGQSGSSADGTFVIESRVMNDGAEKTLADKMETETMQSTTHNMESQLQELHKVIKERDMEIVLYLEEVETLKEQLKVESDQHGEIMLALQDTLREKVASALVSEAQLKAIQLHTKQMQDDDASYILEKESQTLQDFVSKSSEETEQPDVYLLNFRLLELEKQLSDLHEQLDIEREQVNMANQQVAEKERQLLKLQEFWGSTRREQEMDRTQKHAQNAESTISPVNDKESDFTVTDFEHKIQMIQAEGQAAKEELSHYREMTEKLKQELMVKESSLAHLEEDLREVKKCFAHAEEKLAFYMKRELQQEEQQNASGIDFTDSVRSPGWTSRDRTSSSSSSSQTDKISHVHNSNQTAHVHHKNIGVQNELQAAQPNASCDEVAELMECYTEKIGQMQELHAAEILDMEARHISEVDSLRREQYTTVQALTNECESLKAVMEALKTSTGGVPDSALSASYHFTDAASSECDWSQGTYDVQSFDQPLGLGGDEDLPTELIPAQIKDLLRAVHHEGMQVLSLTEATSPDKETSSAVHSQSWRQERKALLETIASLKGLLGKMQIHREPEAAMPSDFHDSSPDWRGELLRAIQDVFCREQDVLMSAFHTQLATLGNCNAAALLNLVQHRLQEQGMEQINAMDCIQNADRRSLLLEIQDLRAQLTNLQGDAEISPQFHPSTSAGAVQYVQPDQASYPQEIHLQLNSMKAKASELQDQLGSERLLSAEIKRQLAQTKMELESTLKLQHKHFKELESVRMDLKKRRQELDGANDALENEKKKNREMNWALEKEKTKRERSELREKEELEDLQMLLENQKSKNVEINKRLEERAQLVKSLQDDLASRESLHESMLSQERSRVSELQAFLVAEKSRSSELANALECRQGLGANVQGAEGTEQPDAHMLPEDLLRELQGQLDSKHNRIVELVSDLESHKLECVQLRQSLEEQKQSLQKEQQAATLAGKEVQELTATVEELQKQIQEREGELRSHQAEVKELRETVRKLQESEKELSQLSAVSAPSTISVIAEDVPNVLCPDPLSEIDGDEEETSSSIDAIRRRLQKVSCKLRKLAAKANQRVLMDSTDDNDFDWSLSNIQTVLSQLEQAAVLSLQGQNLVLPAGMAANTLTEKLLTQNAELTGYVSRLTGEKSDLQNTLLRLEGEVSRHRARGPSGDYSHRSPQETAVNIEALQAEREAWAREKLNLYKSLKQTEAELSKARAELRAETMQRDLGRDTENVALKRVYGKYLRSESFRKALVYQKKYLLLLLGGFQECEEATLALIARMGGQPANTDLEVVTKHSRAFTRFRSAARVAVAISRMRFLVRRWQRTTSPSAGGVSRNGFGQNPGNEVRTDSPYHPTGSVDLYGEQRLSSCRTRSGFDSPQSTVNSQPRYISSELSPCSHLQQYDPDRALTDYIARLEALQKRLGSVPSGSSATNTTPYGIRR